MNVWILLLVMMSGNERTAGEKRMRMKIPRRITREEVNTDRISSARF